MGGRSADDSSFVARRPVHLKELTAFLNEVCEARCRRDLCCVLEVMES